MSKLSSKPTLSVRDALDDLLRHSEQTQGKEVADMFLGPDIFVAVLRQRRVVEGEWEATERTVDLMDLMDQFDSEINDKAAESLNDVKGYAPEPPQSKQVEQQSNTSVAADSSHRSQHH